MHKFAQITLVTASAFLLAALPVSATDYTQDQWQKLEIEGKAECTGGSYGQDITCKLKVNGEGEQEQGQDILGETIVYVDGQKVHVPVDTALDTRTIAVATSLTAVGALAFIARRRLA